jgi:hypothetical protein
MTGTVKMKIEECDVLRGMKAISGFLSMSEATVLRWMREYDDFPVKKNGQLISSRSRLNAWYQAYLER